MNIIDYSIPPASIFPSISSIEESAKPEGHSNSTRSRQIKNNRISQKSAPGRLLAGGGEQEKNMFSNKYFFKNMFFSNKTFFKLAPNFFFWKKFEKQFFYEISYSMDYFLVFRYLK